MAKYGRYHGSKTEEKEAHQMLGNILVGIVVFTGFVGLSSIGRVQEPARKKENTAAAALEARARASQVQSEKAAYQNQINQTVNDCSSALDALSRHEQSNHADSNEAVDHQIQLINLKDNYCN